MTMTSITLGVFLMSMSGTVNSAGTETAISPALSHPDHGAPFHEQLAGQWVLGHDGESGKRLRFYEDGRFAFLGGEEWTAGSYFILRSDERQKGVLRLEYYLDGNLHFQEVRCEIRFETHADHSEEDGHHHEGDGHHHHDGDYQEHGHGEEHSHDHDHEEEGAHHHEMLHVEVLPAAEQALPMDGHYEHVH